MALSVVMPALEMAQETGKLVAWLKKEGEQVRKGDMLLEVETDKAVVEIEALGDGVLAGVTAKPGDVVPVGRTIAWLLQPGEAAPSESSTGNARVSPKARRLAKEHGVDLERIMGSGPGGEILTDDVLAAAEQSRLKPAPTSGLSSVVGAGVSQPEAKAPSSVVGAGVSQPEAKAPSSVVGAGVSQPEAKAPSSVVGAGFSRLDSIGRLMAERTTQSWTTVPHFFLTREIDATALNAARQRLMPAIEKSHGVKITHTDLLIGAVARTLRLHPRMNASWIADGIVLHDHVNVAVAVAVESAVVTIVVSDADTAPLGDVAVRRRDLSERARAGRLQPADISGATFTISNLGMFGIDAFTAIIVPPQAGILAVGAIADRPVAADGRVIVQPTITLTLSCDHRVIDGAGAAGFLGDLAAAIAGADSRF
jgi:pyruvate dehydrogenase E2 component (dihydrolipoamide acetyltransferase)